MRSATTIFFCLIMSTPAVGQFEHLEPANWFPTDLGSYWHYTDAEGTTHYIVETSRESDVNGSTWVNFEIADCEGPRCAEVAERWNRLDEDFYVLYSSNLETHEVLWETSPRSILTVNQEYDGTLESAYAVAGSTTQEGFADVYITDDNETGSEEDGTIYTLRAVLGESNGEPYCVTFVYNIGITSHCDEGELRTEGAIVGGIEYGDTSHIHEFLNRVTDTEVDVPAIVSSLSMDAYPNPFRISTNISVTVQNGGVFQVSIYNVLGQRVYEAETTLPAGGNWTVQWPEPGANAGSEVYFIRVRGDNGHSETKTIFRIQ